ncbi:COX15/CtaA family protein [bacterium]|nr:COX15/CtaA family protein [bacterium]
MLSCSKYIPTWLLVSAFMVFLMIIIGGITRLTGSGLSMVEWRPLYGFLPPMSDLEWNRVFQLYKLSPEYIFKNYGIELSDFKKIFFWEYFHRLWGRLIGIIFIIPFFIFLFFKQIPKLILNKILIILLLGSAQGFIGWWMVKSGLINDPSVSQYRLAIHLSNALLILTLLAWTFLDTKEGYSLIKFNFSLFVFFILFMTIVAGAFVAGMDAGLMYNEYPLMGDGLIPENYGEYKLLDPFENPASAQFHHRHLALLTMICVLIYCFKSYINKHDIKSKRIAIFLSFVVFFQFLLGIITLINMVPVHLGALHQTSAVILLLGLVALIHRNNIDKKIN